MAQLLDKVRPTSASLAYALFLGTNAACIWGGVFPFLPLEFQTRSLLLWFFLAQATVFSLTFFAAGAGAYLFPRAVRKLIGVGAAVPYFIGWCFLIAAIYVHGMELPLTVAGGVFLGLGSAGFYLLFQRLFVAQEPATGIRNLILGNAWAAVIYFALYLIPRAVTAYLIPLVFMPLFSLAIVLNSRTVDRDQPMFSDVPREHPETYRQVHRVFWRSALCMASLGFCTGLMRAMAIEAPVIGSYVNILSMGALLVASLALLELWSRRNLRLDVQNIYRILFPIIITALVLLPFMPVTYTQWLAGALYAVFTLAILTLMLQAGQASRDYGVSPIFLFGLMGGTVFLLHDFGFIVGNAVDFAEWGAVFTTAAIALIAVWLLALMYFVTHNRLKDALTSAFHDDSIELTRPQSAQEEAVSAFEQPVTIVEQVDFTSAQIDKLRERYGLSAREAEVAEQVVRGKTVARIAEDLYVSENTIRTHTRRIYAKLGIHKKIELVDLVETL